MKIRTFVAAVKASFTDDGVARPFRGGHGTPRLRRIDAYIRATRRKEVNVPVLSSILVLTLLPVAAHGPAVLTASNGVRLPTPEIADLSCDQRADLLWTFSESNYRQAETLPEDHPDRAIFEYEDRLADAFYRDCQVGTTHFENATPAFSKGFK